MTTPYCGLDEAGRGPLAGPVYAACVVLDPNQPIAALADSKQLSPARREELAHSIRSQALAWSVACASVEEIDRFNILQASLLAMRRAFTGLEVKVWEARVDGNQDPRLGVPTQLLIGGDRSDPAISAASILAKTARDAEMMRLHAQVPNYGFDRHKGYPTPAHLQALRQYGVCIHHRASFAPVRALLARGEAAPHPWSVQMSLQMPLMQDG